MSRKAWIIAGVAIMIAVASAWQAGVRRMEAAVAAACAPVPERGVAARELAYQNGYKINDKYQCIDRASFDAVQKELADWERQRQIAIARAKEESAHAQAEAERIAREGSPPDLTRPSLALERQGFKTRVALMDKPPKPLPRPPGLLFAPIEFDSANRKLSAFVSPDPRDGQKRPAIIWLTGGDTNSLGDFWRTAAQGNRESAMAFQEAGIVMMFPTLRGGNTNPGSKEYFFGEVDDVLAAADRLASLPYVDPARIYLGGHSTGGTLALLVAETSPRFKAVFSLGPVAAIERYAPEWLMGRIEEDLRAMARDYDANANPPAHPQSVVYHWRKELRLRSPGEWLFGIRSPVYVFEGERGNVSEWKELCSPRWTNVRCASLQGHDHWSYLPIVTGRLAAQVFATPAEQAFNLPQDAFQFR